MPKRQSVAAYDVIIAGGGVVGTTIACALGDSTFKVALLERASPAAPPAGDYDLRVSAITLASQRIFDQLGAWETMAALRVSPVEAMHVWDDAGPGSIDLDSADIGEPCLAYIVENRVMVHALAERLQGCANVHALYGADIESIKLDDGASVALADGRRLKAPLLIGADGAQSAVRDAAHIAFHRFPFRQHGIVATVRTEKPHGRIARQRFLPTGPIALLPLGEPYTSSLVWSIDDAAMPVLKDLDAGAFAERLGAAFGDSLGMITVTSERAAFPLVAGHAAHYVAEHVALIGDAAHTVHPLAGQGANLGILDAATLAEVLHDAATTRRDIGARRVLRRYERWRKEDNLAMLAATSGFKLLFGNTFAPLAWARNLGLSATDRLGPVKRLIMRQASGIDGDLPVLARREGER